MHNYKTFLTHKSISKLNYTVKSYIGFSVSRRDVTFQTLPGREYSNYSRTCLLTWQGRRNKYWNCDCINFQRTGSVWKYQFKCLNFLAGFSCIEALLTPELIVDRWFHLYFIYEYITFFSVSSISYVFIIPLRTAPQLYMCIAPIAHFSLFSMLQYFW